MKQKTLLKTMLLLCALIVGYGSAWAGDVVGTINFGSATGCTNINQASVTGNDSQGNEWTITTVGTTSFTPNASYAQVGSSSKPATSITFTTTLPESQTIKAFSAKFGGFNSTAGTVTLKVGETTVGTGSLNAANDVTVEATNTTTSGDVLTVTVTGISKGVKCYYISYTYEGGGSDPSISADNVNITQDATSGSIAYTLNNATGNVEANVTTGSDWLTLGTITASEVPFTCSANTGAARTATVTLSFTGATDKVVTITQAAKSVASPTFNLGNGSYFVGTEITLTSAGNTIYYTMTTDDSDPATPTSNSTLYSAPIALGNSTTKIWAIAYDTYGNKSYVVKRTYTGVALATLPFSWDKKETSTTGVISNSIGTYSSSPYLKFDATGDYIILKFNGVPGTLTFDIKGNGYSSGSTSTFKVQTSTDGETYTDLATYTVLGDKQTEVFNNLGASVRYIKWIYTEKGASDGGNVALGNINLYNVVKVKLAASGYASFCSPLPLDLPSAEDYAAYKVAQVNKDAPTVLFEKITGPVPAGTPFILYGEGMGGTTVNLPVATGETTEVTGNALIGTLVPTEITTETGEFTNFGLSGGSFVKMNPGTIPANKAYLPVLTSYLPTSAPALTIVFGDDETTGIGATLNDRENDNVIYDLSGRRVAQPTKGIYIMNGKKVVIK